MREVNPAIEMLEVSARTGDGMDAWIALLEDRLRRKARQPAGIG